MKHPRLILAIGLLSVSTSSVFARLLPEVHPVVIGAWRMLFAAAILWGYTGVRSRGALDRKTYGLVFLAGIFLGLHFACYFGALKYTTVSAATFLSTTAPAFTIVIETVFLKRPIKKAILYGVLVAFLGSIIVQFSQPSGFSQYLIGNSLGIMASVFMAAVLMLSEKIRKTEDAFIFTRSMYLVAGSMLALVALTINQPLVQYSRLDFTWLFLLGLIPTVMGHTSFYYAIRWVSPTVIASIPLGEPIIASVLVWLLFAETPTLAIVAGGLIILIGLITITRQASSPT